MRALRPLFLPLWSLPQPSLLSRIERPSPLTVGFLDLDLRLSTCTSRRRRYSASHVSPHIGPRYRLCLPSLLFAVPLLYLLDPLLRIASLCQTRERISERKHSCSQTPCGSTPLLSSSTPLLSSSTPLALGYPVSPSTGGSLQQMNMRSGDRRIQPRRYWIGVAQTANLHHHFPAVQ